MNPNLGYKPLGVPVRLPKLSKYELILPWTRFNIVIGGLTEIQCGNKRLTSSEEVVVLEVVIYR